MVLFTATLVGLTYFQRRYLPPHRSLYILRRPCRPVISAADVGWPAPSAIVISAAGNLSPALMARRVHVNRLLYGPLKLQLSRQQTDDNNRWELRKSSCHSSHTSNTGIHCTPGAGKKPHQRKRHSADFGTLVQTDQLGSKETYGGGTKQRPTMYKRGSKFVQRRPAGNNKKLSCRRGCPMLRVCL